MRCSATVLLTITLLLAGAATGQECALQIGAWEAYPPKTVEGGGVVRSRKAGVRGFSASAVNQTTRKTYKSFSLLGNTYFEDMPEGLYKITVRSSGFKTIIQTYEFSCKYARDDIAFVDILLPRGNPSQVEEQLTPNTVSTIGHDRYTVKGDINVEPMPPTPPMRPIPKQISGGVLNGKATSLPKPTFPTGSWPENASGIVSVQVLIDEEGNVVSASAVSGHPLLRPSAVKAARAAKFPVTRLSGQAVKVSGVITYTVVPD